MDLARGRSHVGDEDGAVGNFVHQYRNGLGGAGYALGIVVEGRAIGILQLVFAGQGSNGRIENAFCRLKDFCRIATHYDRLARNFLASACLVAAIIWWIL